MINQWQSNAFNPQWSNQAGNPQWGNQTGRVVPPRMPPQPVPQFQGAPQLPGADNAGQVPGWQTAGYGSALEQWRAQNQTNMPGSGIGWSGYPGGVQPGSQPGPRQGGGRAMPGTNQVQGSYQPSYSASDGGTNQVNRNRPGQQEMSNETDGSQGGPFRPFLGTYGARPEMGYSRYGYNTPGYGTPQFGRNYSGPGSDFRSPGNTMGSNWTHSGQPVSPGGTSGYYQDPRRMSGNYQANNPNMMGEITRQMFGG